MSSVSDLTIQACYNPSVTPRMSDVFLYAKVDAKPSSSISIIHLQYQIPGVTLLRVTPLNPDGTSPRDTPGVSALKIPVLRRARTRFSITGIGSDKAKVENPPEVYHGETEPDEPSPVDSTRPQLDRLTVQQYLEPVSPLTPTSPTPVTPGACPMSPAPMNPYHIDEEMNKFFSPARVAQFDGAATPRRVDTVPCDQADSQLNGEEEFTDDSDIDEGQTLEILRDETMGFTSENGSVRGVQSDVHALGLQLEVANSIKSAFEKMTMHEQECRSPNAWIGSERSGIFEQTSIPRISIPPAEDFKRFEDTTLEIVEDVENSSIGHGGMDGAADELLKGVLSKSGGNKKFKEQVSMTVKEEEVIVCFPENLKATAYVIEVYVRIPLISLGYSTHAFAFVMAGLPLCKNPASLEFLVTDDPSIKWQLDAGHGKAPFELIGKVDGEGIFGKVKLDAETPLKRSLVVRALRIPTSVEIYDHKIGSWTNLTVQQHSNGGYYMKVTIAIAFYDVTVVEGVSRNLLNIILINCGDIGKDDLHVCNDNGDLETFELDGPVTRGGKVLKGTQLLQLARHPDDVGRHRLWISYETKLGSEPSFRRPIPVAEIGGPEDIMEQTITVRNEVPSLKLRCSSVNPACWTYVGKADGSQSLKRLINDEPIQYPSIVVSSMERLSFESPAMTALAEVYKLHDIPTVKIVDKVRLDFQEQEPWTSLSVIPLKLAMSFSLNTGKMGDHRELMRLSHGEFELDFVTVNGQPLLDGLFLDNGDLVVNNMFRRKSQTPKITNITIYWAARQGLMVTRTNGGRYYELLLPHLSQTLVMRVVSTFHTHRDIHLISRTFGPQTQSWSAPYIFGKASMSGVQTFKSNMHLQIKIGQTNISSIKLLKALIDIEEARVSKERLPTDTDTIIEPMGNGETGHESNGVTALQNLPRTGNDSLVDPEEEHNNDPPIEVEQTTGNMDGAHDIPRVQMDGTKSEFGGQGTPDYPYDLGNMNKPDSLQGPEYPVDHIAPRNLSSRLLVALILWIGFVGYYGFNRLVQSNTLPQMHAIPSATSVTVHDDGEHIVSSMPNGMRGWNMDDKSGTDVDVNDGYHADLAS
ncbi:hypothetical protein EX30DRAFT_342930 [Ascodesmis nigricans]|uniref:Uncharacterized protein n=1 Tax=Ascodesmis nigricans TaxID=341454 RepID=A0A4V3SI46_9PEZI|nr:hypothetical protein EX30DRAFT_342930 [Ascodesmis nigricans]